MCKISDFIALTVNVYMNLLGIKPTALVLLAPSSTVWATWTPTDGPEIKETLSLHFNLNVITVNKLTE